MNTTNYDNKANLLEELELLERLKLITLRNNLSAGILFIPVEMEFSYSWDEESSLADELMDALVHQIQYVQENGESLPIVLKGDPELYKQVRHIKFNDGLIKVEDIEKRIAIVKNRLDLLDEAERSMV